MAQMPAGPTIEGSYQEVPFLEVVEDLENRYPIHFFFLDEWVDSLIVSARFDHTPLDQAAAQLVQHSDLYTHLSGSQDIIITRGFQVNQQNQVEEDALRPLFDPSPPPTANAEIVSIENQEIPIGDPQQRFRGETATLIGYLRNSETGEPISGASVFKKDPIAGVITDPFGYYVLTVPKGSFDLYFTQLGMKDTRRKVALHEDGRLDVNMETQIISLKEVEIKSERSNAETVQTGAVSLSIREIKTIPTVLGEADVMKIALTLPGVQTVGEGSSGFNVRGGNTDQNLISLDEGTIFNPNHLFGFFSTFNPDVIKRADLHKSGVQARYGGRIASYFDVGIREGNKKQFGLSGGLGPVSSRLTLEGPLKKEKSSFLLGVRSTYSDWILNLLEDPSLQNSSAYFGDVIAKISLPLNDQNTLSISGYHSRDQFRLNSDTLYRYFNTNATVQWRHIFNNTFSGRLTGSFTNYTYSIDNQSIAANSFGLNYAINQAQVKLDFDYFPERRHHITFGIHTTGYQLDPGEIFPLDEFSIVQNRQVDTERGLETALYLGDEFEVSPALTVYGGIRLSGFALMGPGSVRNYESDRPLENIYLLDTTYYSGGKIIQTYGGPEYRLGARYKLADEFSVKISFDRHRQYLHMLSNTIAIAPTDTWRLSNPYLPPQISNQFAVGLYRNLPQVGIEFSIEAYLKRIRNLIEYKNGADLLVNEALETDVVNATGRSYGVEMLLKKKSGKLNGWISYTYSRALLRTNSPFIAEQINFGQSFPANFDKPHNLTLISNYKFNWRFNTSFNATYSTGRPTTFPLTKYPFAGTIHTFFTERNRYRIPDYLRFDIGFTLEGNHKVNKLIHGSWTFSIYNITGRKNAYSVYTRINNGIVRTYQVSVFAQAIPTLTYNFRFQ